MPQCNHVSNSGWVNGSVFAATKGMRWEEDDRDDFRLLFALGLQSKMPFVFPPTPMSSFQRSGRSAMNCSIS
jgi:hypothetical protein